MYEIIESTGVENFNRDLSKMMDNGFMPYNNFTATVIQTDEFNSVIIYTQMYFKVKPQK